MERVVARRPHSLLARLLEEPDLPARVERLSPGALLGLVRDVGLEDASELISLASTNQLEHMFDDDLWRADEPGETERFDANRFLLWLEVLLEAGDAVVAARLAQLPEELVTFALHRAIHVVPLDVLMSELQNEDEDDAAQTEKALSDALGEEIDEWHVFARRSEGWDAVLAALLALDRDHHDVLQRVLTRCADLSAQVIDDAGGLYDVLTGEASLEDDLAGDREERRGEAGFVPPLDARAFLALASKKDVDPFERDAITRRWLRGTSPVGTPEREPFAAIVPPADGLARRLDVSEELALTNALRALDPATFTVRSQELAYLVNVLATGAFHDGRKFRPIEAIRATLAITNLGYVTHGKRRSAKGSGLATWPCDALFRVGFARLHAAVVEPAVRAALHGVSDREARALLSSDAPWRAAPLLPAPLAGLVDMCPRLGARFLATDADLAAAKDALARLEP